MEFDGIGRSNLRFAWLPKALLAKGTDWAECVPDLIRRPGEGLRFGKAGVVPARKPMIFSLFSLIGCHRGKALASFRRFLVRPEGPFLRPDL